MICKKGKKTDSSRLLLMMNTKINFFAFHYLFISDFFLLILLQVKLNEQTKKYWIEDEDLELRKKLG